MEDSNSWDCSVCTYRNSAEAFKCLMCDVRKGTSTRKPRINPEMVAKQVARQQEQIKQQALKSVVKVKTGFNSDKSPRCGSKLDDQNANSNSSIASDNSTNSEPSGSPRNGANAHAQNGGSHCSTPEPSPQTGPAGPPYFDYFNKTPTASGSKSSPMVSSSSRNSTKNETDDETIGDLGADAPNNAVPSRNGFNSDQYNHNNNNNSHNNNNNNGRKAARLFAPKAKLKNVNRTNAQSRKVTVNNVTVIITEFSVIKNQRRFSSDLSENHYPQKQTSSPPPPPPPSEMMLESPPPSSSKKGSSSKNDSAKKETSSKDRCKTATSGGESKKASTNKAGSTKQTGGKKDDTVSSPPSGAKKRAASGANQHEMHNDHNHNHHHGFHHASSKKVATSGSGGDN